MAIMGLGYVGLPLACEFVRAGFRVTGFDIDRERAARINQGVSHVGDVSSPDLSSAVRSGRFRATSDAGCLRQADAVIICVPTPLRKTKDPDISYIVSAVDTLAPRFHRGQLVILESTTYPGTTREVVLPRLEEGGLRAGRDFFLAFSPERVDPGNKRFGIRNTPKIVGGATPESGVFAAELYRQVVEKVVPVSSSETAEMAKLLENTFRAVNIALVNEVALMCDKLGLNAWEVIDAAATKPFGFMPFYPGPGIGGHCIPLDPHYLLWKLKILNFNSRFIELAEEINSHMPDHVVKRVVDGLNRRGKPVKGSKVMVLGVAYKRDVSDHRESPALNVIAQLAERGAVVKYHDPYVPSILAGGRRLSSTPLSAGALSRCAATVILTDHSAFDVRRVVAESPFVVDCRNAAKGIKSPKVVRL